MDPEWSAISGSDTAVVSSPQMEQPLRRTRSGLPLAFSLVEIMVVVALLSVIILGLMAMFTQTQKAFRTGLAQTDILESGRIATDLIMRELSQITPCNLERTNASPSDSLMHPTPNFFSAVVDEFAVPLAGSSNLRTNVKSDFFFMIRNNQTWTGIGYFVRSNLDVNPPVVGSVGTLFRFETNYTVAQFQRDPGAIFAAFDQARLSTNYSASVSKVLDGVVDFRIRPFDVHGWMLTNNPAYYYRTNLPVSMVVSNLVVLDQFPATGEIGTYSFYSNAVPAALELQIGILERPTLEHYQSIPVATAQANYLAGQASHVHVFRQRVPVRNVDPSAY
jgi:type II secretory pathway pseudopilin PulG